MALAARTATQAWRASKLAPIACNASRSYATAEPDLKATLREVIPAKRELLKKVKAHSGKSIGEVKIENTIGGMRGLKAMVWEGSVLDANEGIRFHGRTIKDCQKVLPKGTSGTEMLPEAMFWLLLTGRVPSTAQVRMLSKELAQKAAIPAFVEKMLNDFPKDMHPMTQFACAVSALNYDSAFAKMYEPASTRPTTGSRRSTIASLFLPSCPLSPPKFIRTPIGAVDLFPPRSTRIRTGRTISLPCLVRAVINTRASRICSASISPYTAITKAAMFRPIPPTSWGPLCPTRSCPTQLVCRASPDPYTALRRRRFSAGSCR